MRKNAKRIFIIDILILIIVAVALGVSMIWSRTIELALGLLYEVPADSVDESEIVTLKNGVRVSADGGAELKVHFVDVGQGDCTIIELPDGKTMIIDGGDKPNKVETAIQNFIDATFDEDFKYFDYAILTHADADHCGSLDYVLNKYPARICYRPNVEAKNASYTDQGKENLKPNALYKSTEAYVDCIKAMYQTTADFTSVVYVTDPSDESQTIVGGTGDDRYSFTFYTPLSDNYGTQSSDDSNNYSPVMILEYQGYKFAMSGDAEEKNLKEFVAKVNAAKTDGVTDKYDVFDDDYCVNVIKAGHHGSENATTLDYLNVLTAPSGVGDVYSVISCGEGNKYGHPKQEALDRIKAVGIADDNVLRTDEKGDITFSVRVENGAYHMFYGDKKTSNPNDPVTPGGDDNPGGDDTPGGDTPGGDEQEPEMVYVYRKLGGIRLTWTVVAWCWYAVLVVLATVHIVLVVKIAPKTKDGGRKR